MILPLIPILACIIPPEANTGVVDDQVSTLHYEWLYDDEGKEIFLQMIVLEATESGQQIRTWRLWKTTQRPSRNWATGEYELIWQDGDTTRRIRARKFVETHSQRDSELFERRVFPKDLRRGLTKPSEHHSEPSTPDEADLIFP